MANSTSTPAEELNRQIVEDLFFEQDVDILAVSYRHGVVRSILILLRSLLFSRARAPRLRDIVRSGSAVAVVFFRNDIQAISKAPARVRVDHILPLDLHSLAVVREQLGLFGMGREIAHFMQMALALKGRGHIGRLCYPLLGWLLFRTFQTALADRTDVALITTNMQHPLSLGVVWAAVTTGHATDFYEHATTPRIVARDRGYREVYVQFEHTRAMLVEEGFDRHHVHALSAESTMADVERRPVRSVGICINFFDSLESIDDIATVLEERGLGVTYRVHDADPRYPQLARLAQRRGARFSDARKSAIASFLATVDLVIAGNSNVLADAVLARRQVVYYWSGRSDMNDYYGLVSHHRLPSADSQASLRTALDGLIGD